MLVDATNLRLLDRLARDGRASVTELAAHVQRSESTVRERLGHLEADGVLRGYGARVDLEAVGLAVRGTVRARCDPRRAGEVAQRLAALPEVLEARFVTGRLSLWVELCATDLPAFERLVARDIAPLGLEGLEVQVTMQTLVEARPPALAALLSAPEAEASLALAQSR